MIWLLRARYLFTTRMLCPLGLHVPWPKDRWHPERCAYCGKVVRRTTQDDPR